MCSGEAEVACLLFGTVPEAWSPKQRWLGEEDPEPSLDLLPWAGLLGHLAVTLAVGRGAGQGSALPRALCTEPLRSLWLPRGFPPGRAPILGALERNIGVSLGPELLVYSS